MNKENLLLSLEKNLSGALKPVRPSSSFIVTTRKKLNFASPVVVARRMTNRQYLLLALTSVVSIALLIITGTRAIFYLIGKSR